MPQGILLADASGTSQNSQNAEQIPQAANSSEAQTFQLDETVITATGYEQDIKYAPASISVVPKEEIMNRPIKDLGDIVENVPGIAIDDSKTGISTINIRGMHEEYTLILVDGKRVSPSKGLDKQGYNSSAGFIPPTSMIERVEVIKGPASLRYGSEAMGGVINIITKKTPDKTTASVSLDARLQEHHADWGNNYGFNGTIFHPINEYLSVNLRGKINYSEENRAKSNLKYDAATGVYYGPSAGHTCVNNLTGMRLKGTECGNPYIWFLPSAYQTASIGGRLTFTPDEKNTFYADTEFIWQRMGTRNTSPQQFDEKRDYERFNVILNHDGKYDFGDISTYLQFNTWTKMSLHGRYFNTDAASAASNQNHGRDHSSLTYNHTFTAASTFTRNFDFGSAGALIFNAGPSVFYERLLMKEDGLDDDGYQIAVFGEGEYLPLDWMSVVAGVRVNYTNDFGVYAAPRAYLSFYPASWLTLKAGFSNGFQVPDINLRYDGYYSYSNIPNRVYYGNKDLKTEKSYNYEVSALIDTPFVNFTLTGYITDYRDKIDTRDYNVGTAMLDTICENRNDNTYCTASVNVDKAQLWGAELDINSKALLSSLFTQWNGGIYVDLGYAYTDTEQKSGDEKGLPLNVVPLHTLTGKLSYKTPNWQLYTRYRGTFKKPTATDVTANFMWGTAVTGFDYSVNIPKYYKDMHLVDLGTSYRFSNGITLGFVINNLFDLDTTKDFFMYERNFTRAEYSTLVPGRNYYLSISADF